MGCECRCSSPPLTPRCPQTLAPHVNKLRARARLFNDKLRVLPKQTGKWRVAQICVRGRPKQLQYGVCVGVMRLVVKLEACVAACSNRAMALKKLVAATCKKDSLPPRIRLRAALCAKSIAPTPLVFVQSYILRPSTVRAGFEHNVAATNELMQILWSRALLLPLQPPHKRKREEMEGSV